MKLKYAPFLLLLLLLAACAPGEVTASPPEIRYGETICVECNMIISDVRFAAGYAHEVAPGRYESIPFDDIGDMLFYAAKHPEHNVTNWYVHDYDTEEWLDGVQAVYVFSHGLQTPMGQGVAAFATQEQADALLETLDGESFDWAELQRRAAAGELVVNAELHQQDMTNSPPAGTIPPALMALGQGQLGDGAVRVTAAQSLHTGYNELQLQLSDADGAPVSVDNLRLTPRMAMLEGHDHGAAVIQPEETEPGLYEAALALPMPGGPDLGEWSLTVTAGDAELSLPLEVAPSAAATSFMTEDERRIFVATVEPQLPGVGVQPLSLFVYERLSADEWVALEGLTLTITPEMPTMGHGSPNNADPQDEGGGFYAGQVNFSMSGPWQVTVGVADGETGLGEAILAFDVP